MAVETFLSEGCVSGQVTDFKGKDYPYISYFVNKRAYEYPTECEDTACPGFFCETEDCVWCDENRRLNLSEVDGEIKDLTPEELFELFTEPNSTLHDNDFIFKQQRFIHYWTPLEKSVLDLLEMYDWVDYEELDNQCSVLYSIDPDIDPVDYKNHAHLATLIPDTLINQELILRAIASVHGWDNLDSYPTEKTGVELLEDYPSLMREF